MYLEIFAFTFLASFAAFIKVAVVQRRNIVAVCYSICAICDVVIFLIFMIGLSLLFMPVKDRRPNHHVYLLVYSHLTESPSLP